MYLVLFVGAVVSDAVFLDEHGELEGVERKRVSDECDVLFLL